MKKITVLIWGLFLLLFQISFSDEIITDSTEVIQKDSTDKGFDLIFLGGAGLLPKTSLFGSYFDPSPVFTYGLEIPLTESHNWSFQLHGHFWISKLVETPNQEIPFYELSNNKYCQTGISTIIKWYIFNIGNKFKMSIHWGYLFGLLKDRYEGPDLGLNLYYRIDDKFSVSLGYKNIAKVHSGGFGFMLPDGSPLIDLITLEIYYDYNLMIF